MAVVTTGLEEGLGVTVAVTAGLVEVGGVAVVTGGVVTGAAVMLNPPDRGALVPAGVVIVRSLVPVAAPAATVKVAVTWALSNTAILLTAIPVPLRPMAVAPVRLVPVIVTVKAVPCEPEVGLTEVTVGLPAVTVKPPVNGLLVYEVVTETSLAPTAASAVMVIVAVI